MGVQEIIRPVTACREPLRPAAADGLTTTTSDDGNDFHFGVGAGYALADNIGIRAEWERINGDDDLDAWTIGAQIGF